MVEMPISPKHGSYLNLPVGGRSLEEIGVIYKSWWIAYVQHDGKLRRAGGPYIEHPLVVAIIVHQSGLDSCSIAAALLHDVLEDGTITPAEILDELGSDYGPKILRIVCALSKKCSNENSRIAWLRIFKGTKVDWEVIIIKLIDRLHNMVCPYAGKLNREIKLLDETKKIMPRIVSECRSLIPDNFKSLFDDLVYTISETRVNRLNEILSNRNSD